MHEDVWDPFFLVQPLINSWVLTATPRSATHRRHLSVLMKLGLRWFQLTCKCLQTRAVEPEPKKFWKAGAVAGAKNF